MSLLAVLVSIPLGDMISKLPKEKQYAPQAYTEATRLPGKPPGSARDIVGTWEMEYSQDDAQVEDLNVDLRIRMVVRINEDGSYLLKYSGHWGKGRAARGLTVDESGTFKLSSDVLILDPVEVTRTELERNKAVGSIGLANEKHLFVVHAEDKRIHLAGRCAPYQLDPICKDWQVENAWFTFKGSARKPGR